MNKGLPVLLCLLWAPAFAGAESQLIPVRRPRVSKTSRSRESLAKENAALALHLPAAQLSWVRVSDGLLSCLHAA